MDVVLLAIAGALVGIVVFGTVVTVSWWIETTIYEPIANVDMLRQDKVQGTITDFWAAVASLFCVIPSLLISAFYGVLINITINLWRITLLMLFCLIGLGVMQYHHELYRAELIISQCIIMPFCNHFLFPLFNIARIAFNTGIILWDFGVDMYAFYEWGPVLIFIKCTIHTTAATDLFAYLVNIPSVFSDDLSAWFAAGFMTNDLDILNTLDAFGLFIETLVAPFTCLCRALDFIYRGAAIWFRMQEMHDAINCLLNFVVRLLQIPIVAMMTEPHRPDFEEATLRACCALKSIANTLQNTVLLLAEIFWGVFTNVALPITIRRVLSVKWARILAEPLCGACRFVNMSMTAIVHYDDLAQASGVGYFQFGHLIDEFKASAGFIASVFTLMNNDAQAAVDQSLLSLLNSIAFLLEWIPGNIFYWLYGGPLPLYPSAPYGSFVNFLAYYFPDYWLKPGFVDTPSTYVYHTALDATFNSLFQLTQAVGNLFANLLSMDPLGGIIQHTLNILVCLVRVLANLTSFIFTILTFDSDIRTTARQVDFDSMFKEMYFLAGSLGDFSRQFATPDPLTNLTCQISANESQNSVFCCFGNLIERLVDVITVTLQQSVHFLQDLITLPTGNVIFCIAFIGFNHSLVDRCLRIPDMSTALFLLDAAVCDFTCTVFSVIPMLTAFQCSFPLPPTPTDPHVPPQPVKPCGHVSTCVSILVCRILRLFLAPLTIINTFTRMTIGGVSYSDFTVLGSFILKVICEIVADALAAFGLLINCTLCAFVGTGVNCDDAIYQLFVSIGELVKFLPMIVNRLLLVFIKLALALVVGFFSGDPVSALIKFVVGILTDFLGGLGSAAVDFLAKFFNALGLGFIGDFIRLLWRGFCPVLQTLLNAFIVVLKVLTFFTVQINFVNFCCDGAEGCVPSQGRKRFDFGMADQPFIVDGVLHVNLDNWLAAVVGLYQWPTDNPCNQTMQRYAGGSWNNMTEWEQNDALYCLMKPYWLMRDDDQTPLANSTCDVMMIEYNRTDWNTIDVLSRRTIIDCMYSRLYVDAVRNSVGIKWLPSDILTNPYRKFVFGTEFARGLLIYWQYFSDKSATSDQFLSATYQNNWASMGLYTGFYSDVHTVDDILQFRDHYRLADYFQWNNASQYEAVEAVSTGLWNFTGLLAQRLLQVIEAKNDGVLDPSVYLQFSYSMDSAASGITNSVYGLFSEVVYTLRNMSAFWSNPANVKKRGEAYEIAREGGSGMWRAAMNQLTMMGIDYRMSKLNESRYWAGNCSVDEGEQFMTDYDRWVRHDERSWAYHLSRWWKNNKETLFTPYPIANPRDGQRRVSYNQSHHLFSYVDPATNKVKGESGRARVNRIATALNQGSTQSNRRWNAMARLWDIGQERVYVNIIRSNMEYAVNYMNRVYTRNGAATTTTATTKTAGAASVRAAQDAELLSKYYKHRTESEKVWHRPEASGDFEAVERAMQDYTSIGRQRKAAQRLHCERKEFKDDGLCKDYRPDNDKEAGVATTSRRPMSTKTAGPNYYDKVTRVASTGAKYTIPGSSAPTEGGRPVLISLAHPRGIVINKYSAVNAVRRTNLVTSSLVLADSYIDLTCYTNISFANSTLCDECFIVDQALGRLETGIAWVEAYYADGQYRQSLNVSMAYFDYAADDNARAVVGDSELLQFHEFPGYDDNDPWYNLRFLGDNTPNKTRFNDVFAMIEAAANATTGNSTNNGTSAVVNLAYDYYYMNAWVAYFVLLLYGALWNVFVDLLVFLSGAGDSSGVSTEFGTFFVDWFFLCDWLTGEDYRGTRKRFSVGETIFMFSVVWIFFTILFYFTFPVDLFSIVAYSGTSVLITFSFFRSISNNFSFLCLPGLDAMLADDLFYFLVFNFMTKCSWFLAFLIKNEEYNNDTCTACDNAGGWEILNCVTELGFGDIFANAIFMLQFYAPGSLQWIRESRWVPVVLVYQIPYVNQRINAFVNVDMRDRANYRQYMGCNYIVTLFWNIYFAAVFLYMLSIVWPVVSALFAFLLLAGNLSWRFYVMVQAVRMDTFISRNTAPYMKMGIVETAVPEHVDEWESNVDAQPQQQYGRYTPGIGMTSMSSPYRQQPPRQQQVRTRHTFDRNSEFSFNALKNVGQRIFDDLFKTDRKRR